MEKDVLVTGAGGFLGSYLLKGLLKEGFKVIGLYHNGISNDRMQIIGDLLSPETFERVMSLNIGCIVHAAAVIPQQFLGQEAEDAAKKNLMMDKKVIELCNEKKIHLVFLSSSSVYGLKFNTPRREDSLVDPMGPYAKAKLVSEETAVKALGLNRTHILRLTSPYGPGQKAKNVLQIFIERAISQEDLFFHGTGNRTQDFISALDITRAVACCIMQKGEGIFNIAGGNPISMKELAQIIIRNSPGCKSKLLPAGIPDLQEEFRANFDISKAKKDLGWEPILSLEDGIKQQIEFFKGRQVK